MLLLFGLVHCTFCLISQIIPKIPEGNWLVKKTVGTTPAILGNKLTQVSSRSKRFVFSYHLRNPPLMSSSTYQVYFEDPNRHFFEIDVDVSSTKVGGGILSMVKGHAKALLLDLNFLLESQEYDELPERLIGYKFLH